jgi:hypothetical protein
MLAGLRTLIQTRYGPDRHVPSTFFDTMPSAPSRQACAKTIALSSAAKFFPSVPAARMKGEEGEAEDFAIPLTPENLGGARDDADVRRRWPHVQPHARPQAVDHR